MRSTTCKEINGNFSEYDQDLPVLCRIYCSVFVDLDTVSLFLIDKKIRKISSFCYPSALP